MKKKQKKQVKSPTVKVIPNIISIPPFDPKNFDRAKLEETIRQKYCIEADELKTVCPSDEELHNYYWSTLRQVQNTDTGEGSKGEEDDYQLTDKNKLDMRELKNQDIRRAKARSQINIPPPMPPPMPQGAAPASPNQKAAQEDDLVKVGVPDSSKARERFEEAGEHLPDDEKVSWEEALEAMKAVRRMFKKKD